MYQLVLLSGKVGNRDYVLTIPKASLEDDAEYSVAAKNVCGEAKSRAQLMVEHAQPGTDAHVTSRVADRGFLKGELRSAWHAGNLFPKASTMPSEHRI